MIARGEMLSASEISSLLHAVPIGVIPDDDMITLYQQLGTIPQHAISNRAYDVLAKNVAQNSKVFVDIAPKRRLRWFR